MINEKGIIDILGVRPIGESVKMLTEASIRGATEFLSKVCMPAAEEFGLLLKDYVATWRRNNRVSIINKAKLIADKNQTFSKDNTAAPRIVFEILEKGSLSDEDRIQNLWAGLLVSSCSPCGDDQSNLIYTQILEKMIGIESHILEYLCQNSELYVSSNGFCQSFPHSIEYSELPQEIYSIPFPELDKYFEHLSALKLISGGCNGYNTRIVATPTDMGLHLIARGNGFKDNIAHYYSIKEERVFFPQERIIRDIHQRLFEDAGLSINKIVNDHYIGQQVSLKLFLSYKGRGVTTDYLAVLSECPNGKVDFVIEFSDSKLFQRLMLNQTVYISGTVSGIGSLNGIRLIDFKIERVFPA